MIPWEPYLWWGLMYETPLIRKVCYIWQCSARFTILLRGRVRKLVGDKVADVVNLSTVCFDSLILNTLSCRYEWLPVHMKLTSCMHSKSLVCVPYPFSLLAEELLKAYTVRIWWKTLFVFIQELKLKPSAGKIRDNSWIRAIRDRKHQVYIT